MRRVLPHQKVLSANESSEQHVIVIDFMLTAVILIEHHQIIHLSLLLLLLQIIELFVDILLVKVRNVVSIIKLRNRIKFPFVVLQVPMLPRVKVEHTGTAMLRLNVLGALSRRSWKKAFSQNLGLCCLV